jgi:hypothetical protein
MKKFIISIIGCSFLFVSGCGTMVIKKPDVLAVKKMAIISVYANTDIHDVEAKENTQVNALQALMSAVSTEKDIQSDELTQIATYGLKAYGEELEGVGRWKVIPPQTVLKNPKFKALNKETVDTALGTFLSAMHKAADSSWVTPTGMPYIPASSLTQTGGSKTIVFGKKDPMVEAREALAEVCKSLDVDAVAVIGLDLAYKKTWLSGMSGSGLFSGVLGRAVPMVAANVVVVNKDAKIVVENLYNKGGVVHSEGTSVPMMKQGKPYLKDSKQEAVQAYFETVQKSAAALKARILAEFAKE